jgi:hypothetical protein
MWIKFLEKPISIKTNPNFWDCRCESDYIHRKEFDYCPICGARKSDAPDSLASEVRYLYHPDQDYGVAMNLKGRFRPAYAFSR